MNFMFVSAASFNQNLNDWDVSSVTDMRTMFIRATAFNGTLSNWNVSSVTDMSHMFESAPFFNQPLNSWNVSSVTKMNHMFNGASSFNKPLNTWNVSSVTDMSSMFSSATAFNQTLNDWNVSSVTSMTSMFDGATSFNQPLNDWNVSSATTMFDMFLGATSFNQNLGTWYIMPATANFDADGASLDVTTVSAQNSHLRNHNPVYGIGSGGTSGLFEITGSTLAFKATPSAGTHKANVTASGNAVFENGNNWRMLDVTVTGTSSLPAGTFVTTWKTTTADESITLPISGSGMTVNWGDGNTATASGPVSHTYNTAGDHAIQITGELTRFHLNRAADASKLVSLDQWGTASWTTMENAFRGASNMAYNAVDSPDLSSVTDMSNMFFRASAFNGDLSSWNVSSVTDMSYMFIAATSFNGDLSSWNVSSVTDMSYMFNDATSFNGDLSSWDVSSVTDMNGMFSRATSFNGDLSSWDVSSVTDTTSMFEGITSFNGDLSSWNVSSVKIMIGMFRGATSFNGDLSSWNVSSVTDMTYMFRGATSFNGDLSSWNVSSVTDMDSMFREATSFNGNLSSWNVSSVTDTTLMFFRASAFNGDLSSWNVSSVTDMSDMFREATSFNQNLGTWYIMPATANFDADGGSLDVTTVSAQNSPLRNHSPVYGIGSGGDSNLFEITGRTLAFKATPSAGTHKANVTASGSAVFENGNNWRILVIEATDEEFESDAFITTWETTANSRSISIPVEVHTSGTLTIDWGDGSAPESVTANGTETHTYAAPGEYHVSMTGDLSRINLGASGSAAKLLLIHQWGDIEWSTMENAFESAANMEYRATDAPDLSGVTSMFDMFRGAASFNGDISDWNVSSATTMSNMFRGATSFDGNISGWNVSSVTNMSFMFYGATSFNQPLNDWNVSSVTDMSYMFNDARAFNQPLNDWNVSSVTHMDNMFRGATAFDGDLSNWDVSSVTHMASMFYGATSFNQSLSSWNVSSVKSMSQMFRDTSFDGDLSSWDVSSVTRIANMFRNTPFNQPLSSWNVSSVTDMSNAFNDATLFNQSLNGWDVSSVIYMNNVFGNAHNFDQNLGNWYVVPDSVSIARTNVPNIVGSIFAQNAPLNSHDPEYNIGTGGNSTLFAIVNGNQLNMTSVGTQSAYTVNVTASEGTVFEDGNNWRVFDVTVTGQVNVDPVLNSIGSQSVNELNPLTFTVTATDDNGDTLTFSMTSAPTGASINRNTGVFSWTPTERQDGTHTIIIQVDDGNEGIVSEDVTVTVSEVNVAPSLAQIDSKTVDELATLTFTASATDDDFVGNVANTLTYSLTGTTPSGASIDQNTGAFSWTPTEQQDGTHTITVQVEDGAGATDSEAITVTVNEVNEDPVLASVGSKQVNELAALSFTASASDGDTVGGTADTLEFSLTGTTPSGASIHQDTGVFSWTPSESQDGTHTITVRVEDGNGGSDSEAITVTVNEVNEDPVLASVGSKQVNELAALSFTASASDGDTVGGTADTLEFSLTGTTPSGASIHQDTGVFSWTPSESQDGTHTITVRVEDGNGGSDSEAITVTVNEVNEDPVLASVGSKQVNELAALSFTASASDGDTVGGTADTLEFSLTGTTPSGASIHQDTGVFSWTPSESQDGTHTITIQVADGAGATDSEAITVTVNEVNEDPVLNSIGPKSANQLEQLTFTATATDGDTVGGTADTLAFSMTNAPTGASINQNTGVFSWTPTASQTGAYIITFQVQDGAGATDSEDVTVTVTVSNQNPVLGSIGSKSVDELATLSFNATATDGNNDTLEFSLTGTPPSGASINSTSGAFSWTPTELQDGSHSVTVRVSDGNGGSDSETITVTVNEVNEDPVLTSVGSKQVNELAALSFTASASDGDTVGGTADTLEFSLTGTPPSGASIHQDTGAFSWTPSESQDGTHTIAVRVDDGNGGSDSETITVTVNEVNEDPVLNSIGPKSANQLEQLTFTATATDGDTVGGTADTLAFSMTNAPTGASINQNTGVFSWTPTASQTGAYIITFQVQDGAGATDSEDVTVTVTVSNQNPVLGSIGSKSVDELATLSFNATATDGNNDTLEFSLTGTPPSGASINSTSGAFSWTPTELQDGSHSVTVRVSDGNGGSDSETITVTVNEVNEDPVLASVGSKQVNELAALSFTASASDGDTVGGTADTLEFSLTGTPPSGASIHQDTGAFSWTPSESQDGTHTIAVRVDDGNGGSDSETITVTVNEVNEDPVLNSIGPKSANQLEQLTFTATATDGDTVGGTADTIEFSMTNAPTGASINQNTGVFSWTPTASQTGAYIITFQVQDGAGATDSEDVTVTVTVSNQNPVLGSIGSKSVDELATLSFNATATDGNNDTLEFSLTGTPPSGASINSTSGAFSWTPTELQDGSHSVTVRVSDGNGGSDSETITVTVNEVNEDPVLASVGSKQVNELAALSFTASASDGDTVGGTADTLEFSLTGTPPSGASIHQDTGVFSWTPSESQDGTHTIAVRVDDGNGGSDSETITVTVNEVNEDPVLNSIGPKSANQLEQLTFTATATDGDTVGGTADTIEFSLTGTPPTGASINQNTGVFSWTPTASQTGAYTITFQVQDGAGATDSEDVTVTVTVSNQNPVLGSIGSKSVDELATLSFNATATDGNNDTLEFSLTGTPPSGASINSTSGAFSWTPTELQDGSHSVTVRVSDGNGGSDSETITVTVNEVNEDPVLASVGSKQVNELAALSFTASASDGDTVGGTADTLEFSLTGTPPSGASIHQDTGVFSWTPSESQDGTHTIAVRVDDGNGGSDSETITVTVNEVNEDPVLNSIGPKSANQLEQLTFTATATDGDTVGGTADTIEFSLTGTPPTGASINQNTGVFSWTPTASQTGAYIITFQVQDGAGATDSEDVTVTVTVSNQNPVLGSIGSKSVDELATLSFNATATDGNNDTLEFSLTGTPPSGASINSTSGAFSWTPTELQDGSHSVTVRVSDGNGGSDSETITVTVNEVNEDPVLASVGSKQVNELAALSFTASASDGDTVGGTADTLEFSLTGTPPSGASIHQDTGVFSWTPSESQDGTHTITVRVEDGNGGSDSETITVTVNEVNEDPVLNSIGPKSANQLEQLTFTATATDGDTVGGTADTMAFSMTNAPTGASINQNTGVFSWTPTASQTGAYTITFQVQDGAGATDSEDVTVTVTVSNQNPVLGSIGSKSVDELATLSFNATATDGNNDTLEFSLTGTPPSGASINSTSGAFSWTPTELQDGSHSVTVRVSDGNGGSDSETITVTVNEVNEDPVLASVGSKQVNELAALSFTASASDGDTVGGTADTLEFSLTGTTPSGASIHQDTGVFSWTPSESQDGTHTITIQVDDGNGGTDSEDVEVTVSEVNVAPSLAQIDSKTVDELATLTFTASATDDDFVDNVANTLTYSLAGTPPTGVSINPSNGAFSWTPTERQDGTHTITIQVDDGNGGIVSEDVTVTVSEVNVAPSLAPIGSKTVDERATLTFTALATDDDFIGEDAATLVYRLASGAPTGASINPSNGDFSWTPSESQDGTHQLTIEAFDGVVAATAAFSVIVNEVNQAPVLGAIPDIEDGEGTEFTFTATASDVDIIGGTPDTLTFSLGAGAPLGAAITGAGAFSWTPSESQDGVHDVTVRATDGSGISGTKDLTITVLEVNQTPTADAGTYGPHGEGITVTLDGSGSSDPDVVVGVPDILSYSWVQVGTGQTVTLSAANTASPTFTSPTVFENLTLEFRLTVTDGNNGIATDTATVQITDDINELPNADAGLGGTFDEGGTTVTLDGSGSSDDNPGDTLTYEWSQTAGTPSVTLSGNTTATASFTTPAVLSDQDLTFTLKVTDSRGGSDTDEVVITVRDSTSDAPIANIAGGSSRGANENTSVTLDGSGSSDPNGITLTYTWSQTAGTPAVSLSISDDTASFTTPVVKEDTPLTFTLVVSNGNEENSASVIITVTDNESDDPVAVATGLLEADEGATVTLDGSGSSDPNGDTLTYSWEYLTGTPPLTLSGATTSTPDFVAPQVGQPTSLEFGLTVRDVDGNESDRATVTVLVRNSANEPPVAAATGPPTADEGATVTLDGSGSSDPNGDTLAYSWEYLTDTPPLTLSGVTTSTPDFVAPHVKDATPLEFRLTVTDTHGASSTADVSTTLLDSHPNLPVADSGQDQTVNEGATVTLDGSGSSDPNGDTLTYEWAQAGTPRVTLSDPTLSNPTFRAPQVLGNVVLEFTLSVTDVDGSDDDTVRVTVQNSGTDTLVARSAVLGTVSEGATVTLDGTASYNPNGDPLMHAWTQVSGEPVELSGANTDTATFQAPRVPDPVTLVFQLAVSDGVTSENARLSVIIPDDRNDPPILEQIPAQSEDELQEVSFQAAAADVDGNHLRFALSGQTPQGASITRDGLFSWVPNQSQDGPYLLNVTVSDGDGGTDSQLVQVTVNDIEPRPVLARASGPSITFTLSEPVTSSGTGPNGFSILPADPPVFVESISGNGTNVLTLSLNGTISRGATLSYDRGSGDVADEDGRDLESFSDLEVLFTSQRRGSTTPPAVDLGTLAYQRLADIPPHIAEQIALRDDSDPLEPIIPGDTFDLPLVINGYGYLLDDTTDTLVPQTVRAGDDSAAHITFTVYTQKDLAHFTLYLNLSDENTDYADSDTYITYKDDSTTSVTDPHGYIGSAIVTVTQEDDQIPEKKTARITVEFAEPMGLTNMVAYMWNTDRKAAFIKIIDAFEVVAVLPEPVVQAADPEPVEPDSELPADPEPVAPDFADDAAADPEPVPVDTTGSGDYDEAQVLTLIRMWSGFEPEMITDEQMLTSLGLDYPDADIPNWMMTELGVLVAKGDVTVDEFMLALQYVLEHA